MCMIVFRLSNNQFALVSSLNADYKWKNTLQRWQHWTFETLGM